MIRSRSARLVTVLMAVGATAGPPLLGAVELAGPDAAVQGLTLDEPRLAGVVLWPAPRHIEGRALPAGTLVIAAEAVLAAALAGETDAKPILETTARGIALGVELPAANEDRFLGLLGRLASPASPTPETIAAAARLVDGRLAERWPDPLERVRLVAFGLLFPGARGPWLAAGAPDSVRLVDAGAVQSALAAVRRRPVELRVVGPAGLAERVARALGQRIGPLPDPPISEPQRLPAAVVLARPHKAGERESTALALAFRISPADAVELGPSLAVLVESLSAGQGSLPQRLRVALPEHGGITTIVELTHTAEGGGVLFLGARAPRGAAAATWRVLEGAVASLRALPLPEDAVFRARQRLDEQAAVRGKDAALALTAFARSAPWSWPPEERWRDPVTAADVRRAAAQVLASERQALVIAGAIPEDLTRLSGFAGAQRVEWASFDPLAESLLAADAAGVDAAGAASAGRQLARNLLAALAPTGSWDAPRGRRATYRVTEQTPLGMVESTLILAGGVDATLVEVTTKRWRLAARSVDEGAEATLPRDGARTALPEADRLAVLAFREPLLLAWAIERGAVAGAAVAAVCGRAPCPGLRAELGEGSVLILSIDPVSHLPKLLRIWHTGGAERRQPDEEASYLAWRKIDGASVVEELWITDRLGRGRRVKLLEWVWTAAAE